MSDRPSLADLARKYGSDKWGPHSYCLHYEKHLSRLRDQPIVVLEIGIGGYDDPLQGGASLRMWEEYFPYAHIHGIDIHDKTAHASHRIHIHRGSQDDEAFLNSVSADVGGFDVVIDDGSHINAHVINTFEFLFPRLHHGGLYAIEDTQTSYWPSLGGSSSAPDGIETSMGYLKHLIHGLNHQEFVPPAVEVGYFARNIVGLHFYHSLVFVEKGENNLPSNIPPDHELRRSGSAAQTAKLRFP